MTERDREALERLSWLIRNANMSPATNDRLSHALTLARRGAKMEALTEFGVGDRIVWSGEHRTWCVTRPNGTGFRPLYAGEEVDQ